MRRADDPGVAFEGSAPQTDGAARVRPGQQAAVAAQWRIALLLGYAALVAVRIPAILLEGRFWAEEQAVYFAGARQLPWRDALFLIHTGYLNLAASLAALLATTAPLADAPFVTSGVAFLLQMLPPVLLATSAIPWLARPWQLAVALVLLLTVQNTGEVWLNAITSQFHLALAGAIILAAPSRGGRTVAWHAAVLGLGAASGPSAAFLAPLFVLRAALSRSRARIVEAGVLCVVSAAQALVVVLHPEPGRPFGIGLRDLALVVYGKQVVLPLLGPAQADRVTGAIVADIHAGVTPWLALSTVLLVAVAAVWCAWASRDATVRWLLAAAGMVMGLSYFAALNDHDYLLMATFGGRYGLVPGALCALVVFAIWQTAPSVVVRRISGAVAVWIAVVGVGSFPFVDPMYAEGPAWRDEVAKVRADGAYSPQAWPNLPIWKFSVGPIDRKPQTTSVP